MTSPGALLQRLASLGRRLIPAPARAESADVRALRGRRDAALDTGDTVEALALQIRLLSQVGAAERAAESATLAALHHELGAAELAQGRTIEALGHFRGALRADRAFVPAALVLGDVLAGQGDAREALRTWERTAEVAPALPLLARLQRAYLDDGRPTRVLALYREALDRTPDDLALGVALGRAYLALEMLDEAADQLERMEARAPGLPAVHASLGTVFEHRGDAAQACAEYRRALELTRAFEWPHRCECGTGTPAWQERCPACRRWNSLRPVQG